MVQPRDYYESVQRQCIDACPLLILASQDLTDELVAIIFAFLQRVQGGRDQ